MPVTATNEYTRFMVEMFGELDAVMAPTAFQGSFFGVAETGAKTIFSSNSRSVEIDIQRRNGRRLASMVQRGTDSENDTRGDKITASQFTNVARVWPLIESEGYIGADQLLDRVAGENPYGGMTREQRLTAIAFEIHKEHMVNQVHTMEYLARESVLRGQHPAILNTSNTDYIYDFYRGANHTITVTNAWNSGSQTIFSDIDTGIEQIRNDAYLYGNFGMLLGSSAFNAMKEDAEIKADADNRRYGFVELSRDVPVPSMFSRYVTNGFDARGWIDTPKGRKVWIFTYDNLFTDDFTNPSSPTDVEWMPIDEALIFHPDARCDRYFGPDDKLPVTPSKAQWYRETFGFDMNNAPMPARIQNGSVIDPRMFHVDGYQGQGDKNVTLRTQSAVILPTTQTDAFTNLQGLIA